MVHRTRGPGPSRWTVAAVVVAALAGCGRAGTVVAASAQTCTSCHGAPPAGKHPQVAGDLRWCAGCHPGTMDATGALVAGGLHRDGKVDATFAGHGAGYADPAAHGRDFFAALSGTGPACAACHGADYGAAIVRGDSCNGCHAAAGWATAAGASWQTSCSFCHGARTAAAQAGYAFAEHPAWAAPPGAISERLGGAADPARTGAHAIHLAGSALAGPLPCATCHEVPTSLAHVSGRSARAAVAVRAPWGAGPADPAAYDPVTGTCATACHGAGRSPAWSSTGLACGGCHGAPPATSVHAGVGAGALAACHGCHAATVTAAGAVDVAGGKHVNGAVDVASDHPAGYGAPAAHGRDFFAAISGTGPACATCHGDRYASAIARGRSCNGCHAAAGWGTAAAPAWETSCSFCHGARDAAAKAGYAVAEHPAWAAPPDAVAQRLTGVADASRTGAHAVHLTGSALAGPIACGACHAVPTSLAHVSGRETRAAVALTAPAQAGLPDAAGYDPASGTCATACHGAGRSPAWSATGIACAACHGIPPAGAAHAGISAELSGCARCHPDTITPAGAVDVAGGRHVNGVVDAFRHPTGYAAAAVHGVQFLDRLGGAAGVPDCRTCHGADYGAPVADGTSCNGCHGAAGWTAWLTSCSFCHGAKDAAAKAGYAVAEHPAWAAPPDAVSQRLTGAAAPTRTGAHQVHLAGKGGTYPAFSCATCHPVPTTLDHVSAARRATVTFDPAAAFTGLTDAERARLPATLATYDASGPTPTCTSNYCHGGTMVGRTTSSARYPPQWSTSAPAIGTTDCTTCHGFPPASGQHVKHATDAGLSCSDCHAGAPHVNGKPDVAFAPGIAATFVSSPARGCTASCHTGRTGDVLAW